MKTSFLDPPRRFDADGTGRFVIADAGSIELAADEQITFTASSGSEYEVVRKDWGYYATPSLNSRLPAKGLRPVLTCNNGGRFFVCLVEGGAEPQFADYMQRAGMKALVWLDDPVTLHLIATALRKD